MGNFSYIRWKIEVFRTTRFLCTLHRECDSENPFLAVWWNPWTESRFKIRLLHLCTETDWIFVWKYWKSHVSLPLPLFFSIPLSLNWSTYSAPWSHSRISRNFSWFFVFFPAGNVVLLIGISMIRMQSRLFTLLWDKCLNFKNHE